MAPRRTALKFIDRFPGILSTVQGVIPALVMHVLSVLLPLALSTGTGWAQTQSEGVAEEERGRSFFILPTVTYSTDTGLGGGMVVFKAYHPERARISVAQAGVLYTKKRQLISSFSLDHHLRNRRDRVYLSVKYLQYPTEFFGIGNDVSNEKPEDYTPESLRLVAFYERGLVSRLKLRTEVYLRKQMLMESESGGLLDTRAVRWSRGRLDAGPVLSLVWDSRDNSISTRSGGMMQVKYWGILHQSEGGAFNSVTLEARRFFNPFSGVVLGLMSLAEDSRGDVPFYMLSRLGGEDMLRGYEYERFRDRSMLLFQQDIRLPVLDSIGGALFIAEGKVAPAPRDLFTKGWHIGYGGGIRYYFNRRDNLVLRIDYARGADSEGWYACFGEAF